MANNSNKRRSKSAKQVELPPAVAANKPTNASKRKSNSKPIKKAENGISKQTNEIIDCTQPINAINQNKDPQLLKERLSIEKEFEEFLKSKSREGKLTSESANPLKAKIIFSSLCGLLLALYGRDNLLHRSSERNSEFTLQLPPKLLNYDQFKLHYPRLVDPNSRPSEFVRRNLLFTIDLIVCGRHNVAYLLDKKVHFMSQSPFKSDRTPLERLDVLGQLDQFDYGRIMSSASSFGGEEDRDISLASPRGREGSTGGGLFARFAAATSDDSVAAGKRRGENIGAGAKRINRFFARLFKGDSYFEIPNIPLDQQSDETRITHIDADLRDCAGRVQNQLDCGACYAFTWNALAEWHYCRQSGGKVMDFSEQHLVDCGHHRSEAEGGARNRLGGNFKLDGCNEGSLVEASEFSHQNGFHLERDYKFSREQNQCNPAKLKGSLAVQVEEFKRIKLDRLEWEQTLREQPIGVEVHLPEDIMSSYQRGIHPGMNCDPDLKQHMLLVGHGRQDGEPYWLLKSSSGRDWGENGFMRLSREAPLERCFQAAYVAKFKFPSLGENKFNELYDNKITFQPTKHSTGFFFFGV